MQESSGRTKRKIRWSKLYTFLCFRPPNADPVPIKSLIGWPGFSRVVFCSKPHLHQMKPHKYPTNYISTTKYNVVTLLPSLIIPVVFVVGICMLKEAVEDWHRFLQDSEVNSHVVKTHIGDGLFVKKPWQQVSVGDVKVQKDHVCYVETMNLDGETNLKAKRCVEASLGLNEDDTMSKFEATINCGDPNPNLYSFVRNLEFQNELHPLCPAHVLLGDSKLQNTEYIYGVVIFTGPDTKTVRKSMNSQMMSWWYLRLQDEDLSFRPSKLVLSAIMQFVRALVLYGYLIPMSLSCTSNLNEELGQVSIILSDKTGTLTCNQMEFRKCSIAGVSYGGDLNEVDLAASCTMNSDMVECSPNSKDPKISDVHREYSIKRFNFRDDRVMDGRWTRNSNVYDITMFFRVMALCHPGIPIEDDRADKLKFEAESPDEVAFLITSQEFGFQFCKRTQSVMVLKELDPDLGSVVEREYKLLNPLEFSSSRKRTPVIVSTEDGQIFILCKGADRYSLIPESINQIQMLFHHFLEATSSHLLSYAENGFRTLAFAYCTVKRAEYKHWNSIFMKAMTTVGPEKDELLESSSAMIKKDLILWRVAAIEDKLQKRVSSRCIDKFAQACLKIWLLTGDKEETAINIGFACSLLQQDLRQFRLSSVKDSGCGNHSEVAKKALVSQIESFSQEINEEHNKDMLFALVVDGQALEIALRSDCASVICCHVTPKQKALITRLVKLFTGKATLAIGDGANDVGMIQEADIGVGISGVEGMQAAMASDFSLPHFQFLERLLIVHGHWCYKRISKLILYFMYKNIAFGLTLFYYEFYTSFSGLVLYDNWYMMPFNVLLTSLPVISLGVFEQDVPSDVCHHFPALYKQGQRGIRFSWKRIIGWILNGAVASLIFLSTIHTLSSVAFSGKGNVADIAYLGTITYTCVIWTMNCQMALIISHFTWIQHLFIWGSILLWTFYPLDDHVIQEMKHGRKDVLDKQMWLREERQNSKRTTQVRFSARVNAKIHHLKEAIQQRRAPIYKSFTNSPINRTLK
ncbi:hypothetical protein EUGRSUZ_E02025 [Eucalyptus grandis]|uniref:Phospholipid-transporting ATPase n=2 Tax=Eucalyptus grandis TaxID=71139 RepID=A0A059C5K8_EUCGR|nr:hypothetical protein EUGRSUZ_E02025 [Eucalyptus grandis]